MTDSTTPTNGNNADLALFADFDDEQAERRIRRVWHEGRWFFSVIDVVGLLTDAPTPRMYWADMKRTVPAEGFRELLEIIQQLKMTAADGKQRVTDAADTETLLRLIQSIPSPKAEPFKQWLARVGTERLREMEDPALAADRMRKEYQRLGYSDAWIIERLKNVVIRNELTEEWRERGAHEGREFALLTDTLSRGTFDLTTAEHRTVKHLSSRQNLRERRLTRVATRRTRCRRGGGQRAARCGGRHQQAGGVTYQLQAAPAGTPTRAATAAPPRG
jgi:hypothetical protein